MVRSGVSVAFAAGHFGQARTEDVELLRIRLKKQHVGRVERIEVAVEEFRGQFLIEPVMRELGLFQQTGGDSRDVAVGRVLGARREQGRSASQGGRRDEDGGENKGHQRDNGSGQELF